MLPVLIIVSDVSNAFDMENIEINIRKLRYRLKRQGLLELDVWLSQLEPVLDNGDAEPGRALAQLMDCESEELLAMMQGDQSIPEELRPWLERK